MEFEIFGLLINTEALIVIGLMFFLGLTFGWLCRTGNWVLMILALVVFSSVLDWMIAVDVWFITGPFILGFLVHTAQPLFRKLTQ